MKPIVFLRTDQHTANKLCVVYLRVILNRIKKDYSLDIEVLHEHWDKKESKVKKGDLEHERKNKLIVKHRNKAQNILDKSVLTDKKITVKDFDDDFKNKIYGNIDFYEFVKAELIKRITVKETYRTYLSQLTKLMQFKKEVLFSDIDLKFVQSYKDYMIQVLKNKPNTYSKSLRMLKTFTNWALEKDLIQNNSFASIKAQREPGKRDFLNSVEVKKLETFYNTESITPGVKNVLRYFLFTCYTGLRFQDVLNLKFSDLKEDFYENEKFNYIAIQMHKTGLPVKIPIIPKATAYMPKMISKNQKIFDVKSGNTTRKRLVTAAKLAGIDKHITFHVARYTVGTTGLENGITIETISDILGHTDIRITKRLYAKTDISHKYKEMLKFED